MAHSVQKYNKTFFLILGSNFYIGGRGDLEKSENPFNRTVLKEYGDKSEIVWLGTKALSDLIKKSHL